MFGGDGGKFCTGRERAICLLELENASERHADDLQRWTQRFAKKEMDHITAKCQRYHEQGKPVPAWVRAVMDERFRQVEQVEQRIQMLLRIFSAHGVLPLDFKPAYSVGDLFAQHPDELEEAERKGGVLQTLSEPFAKVYKVAPALPAAA
jgi:hypothetical protein